MKKSYWFNLLMLSVLLSATVCSGLSAAQWQKIDVGKQQSMLNDDGQLITVYPACAMETMPSPEDGSPLDNAFTFYIKRGSAKNVLVYFNGGGACWNDATCVASLALSQVPGGRPTYNPSILQQNSPLGAGGIFDDEQGENPLKNWTKVFIPYCTGDIHIGSSDVNYVDQDGSVTGIPGSSVAIKHHGLDNFLVVREWLRNEYRAPGNTIENLLVAGSSAGGYGAALNFPYLQTTFPDTNMYLVTDAAASVVTQGFIDNVFGFNKNWNVENTLAPLFKQALGTYSAYGFNAETLTRLAYQYPLARIAQYTTGQDSVQTQFLKIMDQLDQGNTNPFTWGLNATDFLYFAEWQTRMQQSFGFLSQATINYQYYIGAGSIHSVLTDAFATADIPHPFYQEQSAQNVKFSQWLQRFVRSQQFREQSVSYQD